MTRAAPKSIKPAPTPAEAHRKSLLAKIHMGKKALSLSEEDYREVLLTATGEISAATCTPAGLEKVLKVFAKLGWTPKPKQPGPNRLSTRPGVRLVYGLWAELGRLGAIEKADKAALAAFVYRMTGVMSPEWLENANLNKVIEALKAMKARALAKQEQT